MSDQSTRLPGQDQHDKGPLLGRQVGGSETYDPTLLFPVLRETARATLPGGKFYGFGEDVWHAYELSWLNARGVPVMYLGRLIVPARSIKLIESKSLKLYFNSLNNHRFASCEDARATIEADLSATAEGVVSLQLLGIDDAASAGATLDADCLDALQVDVPDAPDASRLCGQPGDARAYTHLLRSLCPVTAQPDWATLLVETRGTSATPESLFAHLLSFRNHQEFHEQCVERIYTDLVNVLAPDYVSVQAFYTRRGGLDICPFRCSEQIPAPRYRLNRQ